MLRRWRFGIPKFESLELAPRLARLALEADGESLPRGECGLCDAIKVALRELKRCNAVSCARIEQLQQLHVVLCGSEGRHH